ncbi:MAG: segregation/condensation protein A [Bdellovibrionales bacterium]|nr:segregation/condensation protein A [Bdellovibrionales bacterium]
MNQFEGPLSLLLFLIKKEEMDIYDIPIHKITQQYLDHIKMMAQLDLEVAGEFIAMAATLIHIKSKMLLPNLDQNGEEEEGNDPRKELVQKLLEYQKYKEISKELYERPLVGRDIWTRGRKEHLSILEGDIIIEDNALFTMISMYRKSVKAFKKRVHKVIREGQSIASRVLEIRDRLIVGTRTTLKSIMLPEEFGKTKLVVTFLSILELSKMGFLALFQSEAYADIHIDTKEAIDGNVISRVEEYDSAGAEALAEKLFEIETADMEIEVVGDTQQLTLEDWSEDSSDLTANENSGTADATADENVIDSTATDDEILEMEMEMGLGDIDSDVEFQAQKATDELASIDKESQEPDILNEISNKYEGETEDEAFEREFAAELAAEEAAEAAESGAEKLEQSTSDVIVENEWSSGSDFDPEASI